MVKIAEKGKRLAEERRERHAVRERCWGKGRKVEKTKENPVEEGREKGEKV